MELIKKNWNDVSINDYYKLVELSNDDSLQTIDRDVEVLAILCNTTPDEIWNLPVSEVAEMRGQIEWLNSFDFDKKEKHFKKIVINGKQYNIDTNVNNMTYAQYVDFQENWKRGTDSADNIASILSCFIIPNGKKYNEGYDIVDMIDTIKNSVSFPMAQSLCFFFLKRSVISTRSSLTSLRLMMKMTRWKMKMTRYKNKELLEEMEKAEKGLRQMEDMYGSRYYMR